MSKLSLPVVALACLAIAVGGCGSSKKSSSGANSGTPTTAASSGTTTTPATGTKVTLAKVSFGKVIVGPNGHTIYLFEKDKGTTSECNGACAHAWMPVTTTGAPQGGAGLSPARFGTTMRKDGTTQITYGKHPLYYFIGDKKPRQTKGEGSKAFGAEWYAVGANGKKVEEEGS
jgi:predicted lipoprotein with Yx(FWY)xxD motif